MFIIFTDHLGVEHSNVYLENDVLIVMHFESYDSPDTPNCSYKSLL